MSDPPPPLPPAPPPPPDPGEVDRDTVSAPRPARDPENSSNWFGSVVPGPDTLIGNRYRLRKRVGRGGMAV
ncbi:MAG TPA: hypothetical protein VKE74_07835, partial [Gemmataceae bacterium]|nr:hypothetical protein [Gemmataceae bacterium]